MTTQTLTCPLSVETLSSPHYRLIAGVRLWALALRLRWCPIRTVAGRLGGPYPAARLGLLIEEIAAAWPDPFCVSPPCARRLSHDESTLVGMMMTVGCGDRPGFDRLLADLLPADARDRLYMSASLLGGALAD